ncbi:hypothetical protein [Bythopirellula goksoeyrii]|uniref:hypothetical protein n=1 Tax=Bythopirellula goksoeyrii TaxID=1400387 RepID=UPI0011CD97E0|nr:hypothetical protein [Bythopirellula goksoeyrii]
MSCTTAVTLSTATWRDGIRRQDHTESRKQDDDCSNGGGGEVHVVAGGLGSGLGSTAFSPVLYGSPGDTVQEKLGN